MKKTFRFLLCIFLILFFCSCSHPRQWLYLEQTTTTIGGKTVRSIAAAKDNLEKDEIAELIIPDEYSDGQSISRIDPYGFSGCAKLKSITLPQNLSLLGIYSFSDCTALKTISIPSGVTVIPEGAFCNCSALSEITLSENLYQISSYAFENCTSLMQIGIPSSVSIIGSAAFAGCDNLSRIVFENRESTETIYWTQEEVLDGEWSSQKNGADIVFTRQLDDST